ncbi:hypothetical protein MBLNU459_g5785t1 [Dothideomycetes sp. NU459]
MDVSAHGVGATNGIAIDCKGSNADGSCKFDELLKDIQIEKRPWSGSTDIGGDLTPDPVHAADQLRSGRYESIMDPAKLFPNIWLPGSKDKPQLSEILSAVTDRI